MRGEYNDKKQILSINFDVSELFPTTPNINGNVYTEEAINKALEGIKGMPVTKNIDGEIKPIGIIEDYNSGYYGLS